MADESESKGCNQIMIAEYHLADREFQSTLARRNRFDQRGNALQALKGRSVAHLYIAGPTWDGEGFT